MRLTSWGASKSIDSKYFAEGRVASSIKDEVTELLRSGQSLRNLKPSLASSVTTSFKVKRLINANNTAA